MKILIRASCAVLVIIVLLQFVESASAAGYENYATDSVPAQERAEFLEKINFELSESEEEVSPISCFAVSNQGLIALGFNTEDDAEINVYSSDGQFLYGYRFRNSRCALAVFFEGEYLSIFWGKSDYIGSFDSEGNCLQFRKVINTTQSNDSYHNDRYRPPSGRVGDIQYCADRGIGLSITYSRFVVEDSEGNRNVIYDVSEKHNIESIIRSIFITSLISVFFFVFYKNKKLKSENDAENKNK